MIGIVRVYTADIEERQRDREKNRGRNGEGKKRRAMFDTSLAPSSLPSPPLSVCTGISTDSGIPDYRSPGRPPYRPIQHADFVGSATIRQRYWARSMSGALLLQLRR